MAEIGGMGPLSPREKAAYEQEYKEGIELFQKALQHSQNANNEYQAHEFQDVMDQALNVLNQTARALKRKDLLAENKTISKDYEAYQNHPSEDTVKQLSDDLSKAKHAL